MRKIITKTLFCILLGIVPTIFIIQNNRSARKMAVNTLIDYLQQKWGADVTIEKDSFNLFNGTLYFEGLKIKSRGDIKCTWKCKTGKMFLLGQESLSDKTPTIQIELNDNEIKTEYKSNRPGLQDLLISIFKIRSKHFKAQSFVINNVTIFTIPTTPLGARNNRFDLKGSLFIKNDRKGLWHCRLFMKNSSLTLNNKKILENIGGATTIHQTDKSVEASVDHTLSIPFFNQGNQFSIFGNWNEQTKSLSLRNRPQTIALTIVPDGKSFKAKGALGQTSWEIDFCAGKIRATNSSELPLISGYSIAPKKLSIEATLGKKLSLSGSYRTVINHSYLAKAIAVQGTFFLDKRGGNLYGKSANSHAVLNLDWHNLDWRKQPFVSKFLVIKNGSVAAQIESNPKKPNELAGYIDYPLVQSLLPLKLKKWFLGNRGKIFLSVRPNRYDRFSGTIRLEDGKIHLPKNYNLIKNLSVNFDLDIRHRRLVLQQLGVEMQKGRIDCNRAVVHWNEKKEIEFLRAHLQSKNVLINLKNDFFSIVNGSFSIEKNLKSPLHISGGIIIKRSLITENIFSKRFLIGDAPIDFMPISVDITIANEKDLVIKTPLLSTKATTDVRLKFDSSKRLFPSPEVSGQILLHHGELTFPKQKLFISSGKIEFVPTQLNNPIINFSAKNRIKKYLVTLQVTGPLKKPTIFLESNPELTEEQIISLLFAGSEKIRFKSDLPAIIMQNLHTLVLGEKSRLPKTRSFFERLTKPLKYVQITPNFTDQSGRGGVRGTLSVDLNEQLHAYIQKNFTMQDDLAFRLEYFLSDNVNLKAIKDARGDLGAEIEFVYSP